MTLAVELAHIEVCKLQVSVEALLAPGADEWERAEEAVVPLEPTPINRQPSAYVQVARRDRSRSGIGEVRVRAVASTSALAAAIMFPVQAMSSTETPPPA